MRSSPQSNLKSEDECGERDFGVPHDLDLAAVSTSNQRAKEFNVQPWFEKKTVGHASEAY